NKIYAIIQPDGVSLVVKTTKEDRVAYTTMDPNVYQLPDNFQNLAFMIIRMDRVHPEECRTMLIQAWSLVAPKKVVKAFNETSMGRN
ncbi:MmcQ/YjbR family DNA-binding protein, partial [Paenibacillus sp. TAF58]